MAPLKNYTILALSNLLSANVDAGLKYSLSMGYHEDTRTRTAFMQVLTNILNQGTEFETLAETVMTDRYEKLVDVSIDFPFPILSLPKKKNPGRNNRYLSFLFLFYFVYL